MSFRPARPALIGLVVLLLIVQILHGGCAANTASIDDRGVRTTAQPSSMASMDQDGRQLANYQGVSPTQLKQDAQGSWLTTPGIGGVITVDPETSKVYIWSPGDTVMEGVTLTPEPEPGQPSFAADRIEANKSAVAGVYAEQFERAMTAIEGMTASEAESRVRQLEQARLIGSDVADLLLRAFVPTLPSGGGPSGGGGTP